MKKQEKNIIVKERFTTALLKHRKLLTLSTFIAFQSMAMAAGEGQQWRSSINMFLGFLMTISFVAGVFKVIAATQKKAKGDPDWHNGLWAGFIMAGAPIIMGIFYAMNGMEDSAAEVDGSW